MKKINENEPSSLSMSQKIVIVKAQIASRVCKHTLMYCSVNHP